MSEVFVNARIAAMTGNSPYGLIDDGALAVDGGRIVYAGPRGGAPQAERTHDLGGRCVTPGLVDPHTHAVYGGNRAREWERRLAGASYADIAREGGGILATVRATRAATDDELVSGAERRLRRMCADGVTTVEIKSGYGLDLETELRMLRVARALERRLPLTIRTTFLGAHALPPEFAGNADGYVDAVCSEMLPRIAAEGLADAVDAFCERIAFTPEQTARVFAAAAAHGLRVKLHADQLSEGGGAELAARFHAVSADHLEWTSPAGIAALAAAGTVAVLLPGAAYFLREARRPPVHGLRAAGVPIAIASDCNPGTSPVVAPLFVLNLACTLYDLTPEEALRGATLNAAHALGMASTHGSLEAGKAADFVVWDVAHPAELAYELGAQPLFAAYKEGGRVTSSAA